MMNPSRIFAGIAIIVLAAACTDRDATTPDSRATTVSVAITDPPVPENGFTLPRDTVNVAATVLDERGASAQVRNVDWTLELSDGRSPGDSVASISPTGLMTARIVFRREVLVRVVASVALRDGTRATGGVFLQSASRAADIIKVSGDNQEGAPGSLVQPLTVAVHDAFGNPLPGARVRFSILAGDGNVAHLETTPDGHEFVWRSPSWVEKTTGADGHATELWSLGRAGENRLQASVETGNYTISVTFSATSVFTGAGGRTFALASKGTGVNFYDGLAGEKYECTTQSGLLVLSPDGSFESNSHFTCLFPAWEPWPFDLKERGFYAVSDSSVLLHYVTSDDKAGFFQQRDADAVISADTIAFASYGVEWRYMENR
jgi:hypothetical protein